jgi:hypothetical protein
MTSILPTNLDYTEGLDQLALEARLMRLIDALWPEWEDRQRADFGNILIRELAFVGDLLAFYQDNNARESRFTTARLRKSLLAFAKLIGYRPRTASAATVTEQFTLAAALPGDLTIPAGARVLTAEVTKVVAYQLLADLVIPAGQLVATATMENSETREEQYVSSGLADQVFRLRHSPYIDGTLTVTAGDGAYAEVENLLDSTSTSRHCRTTVDDRERVVVRFGDGVLGKIPTGTINFRYRTGGGVAGRVEQNRLTRLEGSYSDALGTPAQISVTNPDKSSGGNDRETNAEIKRNGPRANRVRRVLVGREDYEIAAELVPQVARALHLPDVVGPNQGHVYIVTDDLSAPSQDLLDDVAAQWSTGGPFLKLNTYQLTPLAAPFLTIDVSSTVYLSASTTPALARARILASLQALFALLVPSDENANELVRNPRVNFGYYLQDSGGQFAWSDVFNAIRDTLGIGKVDPGPGGLLLNGLRDNVALEPQQFPKLGDVTLINGANGQPF